MIVNHVKVSHYSPIIANCEIPENYTLGQNVASALKVKSGKKEILV